MGFVYYAAAVLCLRVFATKKRTTGTFSAALASYAKALRHRVRDLPELARAATPWLAIGVFLLAFGAFRQMNLQVQLTAAAQQASYEEGWYADRSSRQIEFIVAVASAAFVMTLLTLVLLRRRLKDVGLVFMATTFLVVLMLIRMASHHAVDAILGRPLVAGVQAAHLLEVTALCAIIASAFLRQRSD